MGILYAGKRDTLYVLNAALTRGLDVNGVRSNPVEGAEAAGLPADALVYEFVKDDVGVEVDEAVFRELLDEAEGRDSRTDAEEARFEAWAKRRGLLDADGNPR